ncbi:uncharacterized protein LOC108491427 [Nannospalax galili]|uniref:uncharacterized protein LOC108491427 n=1 Tax=Nannospalax galili TaxID=1026970 RepID=UPI00081A019A|nr:uncharacterized protein LOC108491427 [Nannospalax galili]
MYSFVCLPRRDGIWPAPLLLPPIQTHNFCSRSASLSTGEWGAGREFHCFYGAGVALAPATVPPWWSFPPPRAAAFSSQVTPGRLQLAPEANRWAPWPEGSSMQAELRWGRVERTLGPRLQLPDFLLRELRRVYGTYPRTDVRVTQRRGEFLLQAAPRVGEPEYRVARRVVREQESGGDGPDGPAAPKAAQRGGAKKKGRS